MRLEMVTKCTKYIQENWCERICIFLVCWFLFSFQAYILDQSEQYKYNLRKVLIGKNGENYAKVALEYIISSWKFHFGLLGRSRANELYGLRMNLEKTISVGSKGDGLEFGKTWCHKLPRLNQILNWWKSSVSFLKAWLGGHLAKSGCIKVEDQKNKNNEHWFFFSADLSLNFHTGRCYW